MLEQLTFLLAPVGYAGLTVTAVAYGRLPLLFWRATVLVIMAHVSLVWHVRYDWQFAQAARNGYAGFMLFHLALLMIIASAFARDALRRRLVWIAFGVVTLGALGAVFKYEIVARYRLPVIVCAVAGILALAHAYRRRRLTSGSS